MNRESYVDNAKFILIFFVVLGHVIQPFKSNFEYMDIFYKWIYLFHMPAFIFLSGFFAKGSGKKGYLVKLFKKLLLPYLVFQTFHASSLIISGIESWKLAIAKPAWSLWFLLSLFCWHILLIGFKKIPKVFSVILAIEIGVIIGYVGGLGSEFSISRTFVFFPFFLLGYWFNMDQLMILKKKRVQIFSCLFLAIIAFAINELPTFPSKWLFGSYSYELLGLPQIGGLLRIGKYAISALMMFAILSLVPKKQNRFTKIGQKTLYVYLLHGIFIYFFRSTDILYINNVLDIIGLSVIALAIVIILASKPVRIITQPLIEAEFTLLKNSLTRNSKGYRSKNSYSDY